MFGMGVVAVAGAACAQAVGVTPTPARPASPSAGAASGAPSPGASDGVVKLVSDVLDYKLEPAGRWKGPFGSVTFKLNKGHHDGQDAWYIRTDSSDQAFSKEQGLVYVPLLNGALNAPGATGALYLVTGGVAGQGVVLSTVPGREDFTPAFRVHRVTFQGAPELLTSETAVKAAAQAGKAKVDATNIVVNYPLVKWSGGGLPKDTDLAEPLGKGPLVEDPDTAGGKVTFKLHQCFPGSRYIVTDTSAVPMAPMMGVAGSAATQKLTDAKATAPITIFLNGLKGPGVMGFQPAVFNSKAGDPAWSPFWQHYAVRWKDQTKAAVLRAQAEIEQRVSGGDLERFNGLPETHPNGFVVNCPAPILAPNTYTGA